MVPELPVTDPLLDAYPCPELSSLTNELAELVQTISYSGFKQLDCLPDVDEECWWSHPPSQPQAYPLRPHGEEEEEAWDEQTPCLKLYASVCSAQLQHLPQVEEVKLIKNILPNGGRLFDYVSWKR